MVDPRRTISPSPRRLRALAVPALAFGAALLCGSGAPWAGITWQVQKLSGFSLLGQQASGWCWAAVGRMIMRYERPSLASTTPSQCELVEGWRSSNGFSLTSCCGHSPCTATSCAPSSTSACPQFGRYPESNPLSFELSSTLPPFSGTGSPTLVEQIGKGSPVTMKCSAGAGIARASSHMMVVVGVGSYTHGSVTDDVVKVADPLPMSAGALRNAALMNGGDVYWVTATTKSPTKAYRCADGASYHDFR
jgi:hypothetical protein